MRVMRRGTVVAFLAAIFLSAALFVESRQGSIHSVFSDVPKDFDIGSAMNLAYGGYDSWTRSVSTTVPDGADALSDYFKDIDRVVVRPLWTANAREGTQDEVFLLTQATPPLDQGMVWNCHACAPLIGAFAFAKANGSWKIIASSPAAVVLGAWGDPPDPRLVVNGPHHRGVVLETSDMHQGFSDSALVLLVPWKDTFGQALFSRTGSGDGGSCGPPHEPGVMAVCFSNRRTLSFVAGGNAEYLDARLVLSGTDMSPANMRVARKVSGMERFSFRNGKYVSVSRTGDKTAAEADN